MHDDEDGVWAVVADAGGKKYIGRITGNPRFEGDDHIKRLVDNIADRTPISMVDAWSYIEMDLPTNGPQGLAVQHITHCRPANNCVGASSFLIVPTLVHLFSEMRGVDRKRNKDLVENVTRQVEESIKEARAQNAGLTLAKPGDMPHGPGRPPGLQ